MMVHSKSKLIGLLPFLDSDDIMHSNGRLRKADEEYQTKHPIILHSQHWARTHFLDEMHKTWHHEGDEYKRSEVQQKFWILGLRNALRSVKHDYVHCKNLTRAMNNQMSNLPASRLDGTIYLFRICGVDKLGPFQVKHFQKTVRKLICLFTCFSTRVIHFKFVSSLDTPSFLDATHRFLARRGCSKIILSDKGTNLVEAARGFRQLFSGLHGTQLEEDTVKLGINCTFNPSRAPQFAGVWENLARSRKKAIWNILGSQSLKEEQLTTIICSV